MGGLQRSPWCFELLCERFEGRLPLSGSWMLPQHFPMKLRRLMAFTGLFGLLKAIFRLILPPHMNSRNTLANPSV
jgi:hypothetical protein